MTIVYWTLMHDNVCWLCMWYLPTPDMTLHVGVSASHQKFTIMRLGGLVQPDRLRRSTVP